ncbi:nicotinamidase [Parendozoicomonas haliclonae]|uniref:nicotinamidase n=1 Tax=Parendozoicomonas haliclonae TaxID=1960125 RepID=A0A1X7AHW6_9GAMM|nr:nicotinamidase [Parendozoicomonas haliclonae]SMA43787.1 nicotinamidase/pyrazinamidase [Parendozoicomonas haliclonae]
MLETEITIQQGVLPVPPRERVASLDVDAQNCFTPVCPNELPIPEGTEIVAELNRQALLASVRIGSKDAHPAGAVWEADEQHPPLTPLGEDAGENVDIRWPRHAVPGTKGFELIEGLPRPADYDFFTWKGVEPDMHPYGCCYHDLAERMSTGVIEYLKVRGIETVLVGGLALDYCVKTSALQLARAGFQVVVNRAACRGLAPETVELALQEMADAGIEVVESVEQLQVM